MENASWASLQDTEAETYPQVWYCLWLVRGGFSCPTESFKQAAQSSESGAFLYLKLGNFPAGSEKKGLECSIKNARMSPDPPLLFSCLLWSCFLLLSASNTSEPHPPSLPRAGPTPSHSLPHFLSSCSSFSSAKPKLIGVRHLSSS